MSALNNVYNRPMHTISSDLERQAAILRLLRADLSLSQSERVDELISLASAERVLEKNLETLFIMDNFEADELQDWRSRGFRITTVLDQDYPALLREVRESPGIIYWQGQLRPDEMGVSVVGSRNASPSVLKATFELAQKLALEEIPVISGLAKGVDSAAHEGALSVSGRTVAIMGTGLHTTYPRENEDLRERIQANSGLVLSQFEPDSNTHKFNFPMRNAVMSGYGLATIVMAATEKSGTKHQAQAALKHGRTLIFTKRVSNNVSWANKLVNSGKAMAVSSLNEAVAAVHECRNNREQMRRLFGW